MPEPSEWALKIVDAIAGWLRATHPWMRVDFAAALDAARADGATQRDNAWARGVYEAGFKCAVARDDGPERRINPWNTLLLARAELNEAVDAARAEGRTEIIGLVQRHQPAGSPPPGDAQILIDWIIESARAEERAACAALADGQEVGADVRMWRNTTRAQIAAAIRARGTDDA